MVDNFFCPVTAMADEADEDASSPAGRGVVASLANRNPTEFRFASFTALVQFYQESGQKNRALL